MLRENPGRSVDSVAQELGLTPAAVGVAVSKARHKRGVPVTAEELRAWVERATAQHTGRAQVGALIKSQMERKR